MRVYLILIFIFYTTQLLLSVVNSNIKLLLEEKPEQDWSSVLLN